MVVAEVGGDRVEGEGARAGMVEWVCAEVLGGLVGWWEGGPVCMCV